MCAAAQFGCVDTVRLLLEKGARVDDCAACPPLLHVCWAKAATGKAADVARLLLEHGADAGVRSENGDSLRKVAFHFDNAEVAAVILEHQKNATAN